AGDAKAVRALERIGPDPSRWDLRAYTTKLRQTVKTETAGPGFNRFLLPAILLSPGHSLLDLLHLFRGLSLSGERLFKDYMAYDAWQVGTRFDVPFFVVQGEGDVFTLTSLVEMYFEAVQAPIKRFKRIAGASHFVAFTHQEECLAELMEHVRPLALARATD